MVLSTLLDPSLLIADEITSALDVSTQKAVGETLVEFRDRGFVKSTIVITHDLSILYQIADSILSCTRASWPRRRPPSTIVTRPRHPYTRALISSLPEVGVRYADKRLTGIPGRPPRCSTRRRLPLPRPLPARLGRVRGRQPPFVESSRATRSPAGRPTGPAARRGVAGRRRGASDAELDGVSKTYRTGTFGGKSLYGRPRRQLRGPAGRGRLADRRERQRQEHDRQDDPAPDADRPAGRSTSRAPTSLAAPAAR